MAHDTWCPRIELGTSDAVARIISDLPEFDRKTSAAEISDRTRDPQSRILIASDDEQDIGFLVSYPTSADTYYAWIMGVLPAFRRKGVSTHFMNAFESHAAANGYAACQVKSMNRYRSMLHLLINRGYQIIGLEDQKILFEKPVSG